MARLYMFLIGCAPKGRHIEQHDVFFGIGESVADVLPAAMAFWPEAASSFHLDAWREVSLVDGYQVEVIAAGTVVAKTNMQLYFLNLGGYKKDEFEEFHYKMIVAAPGKNEAMKLSKQTAFFRHTGFKGATAHIDDKFGVDVDNVYTIMDILPLHVKQQYQLVLTKAADDAVADKVHLGYFRPGRVEEWGVEQVVDG